MLHVLHSDCSIGARVILLYIMDVTLAKPFMPYVTCMLLSQMAFFGTVNVLTTWQIHSQLSEYCSMNARLI
jgi:hypothetical protein